ncbi:DNA replication factor C complex subunit Rfc1 [Knufia obscura]|uniref:Replication factor C subunit 1 n=1 Tax=Knufia obscura TaxID=1635080 RepID=A0ABR0RLS1_9EURO|nr:DNA replication factor C complex subunit Rfc1 [Knufia obscura]
MPGDIRNFFGGGGGGPVKTAALAKAKDTKPQKPAGRGRPRKVVSDDEEDVEETKPKKATPVKRKSAKEEPVEEETTSSAYFAGSESKSGKGAANGTATTPKKPTKTNGSAPNSARRSGRKSTKASYAEDDDIEMATKVDDTKEGGDDDIAADDFKTGRKADDYDEGSGSGSDDVPLKPRKQVNGKKTALKDEDSDLEMAEIPATDGTSATKRKPRASTTRKRKLDEDEDEDEEDETPKKKKKTATPRKKPEKKPAEPDNSEAAKILESVKTVRPPTPPPRDESSKFKFQPGGGNAAVAPMAAGSKEIPEGADNCLAGMTFVFTGVLDSLGREEGQSLVKRYGGKVTSGPSSKTSFVVLGAEAGPKKLETIKKLGLKTIDEDGLFDIIRKMPANGGDSKAAAANAEKKAAAEKKMQEEAQEMERQEKEKQKLLEKQAKAAAAARGLEAPEQPKGPRVDSRLWVDKYAPDSMTGVCGNKGLVEGLQTWLRTWPKRHSEGFKKAGSDGKGVYRAAMLHGPPGIGKTTAAHLVAKLEGYDVVESNASDTRSKKLVETGLKGVLDTTSLLGYFAGDGKKVEASKRKLLLIMDEVDGMSAGDRGGVGALAAVAKKTNIPMILICNDRKLPKMKPFDFATADFPFRRPTVDMIRSRILTICFREGLKLPKQVIDAIIEGSHADIRQIINMLSTIKVDNKQMEFNDGKAMSKAWEKHVILKPWDIVNKILRAEMFAQSSTATLNDKIELYFNDHEFSYLMLQENYLKTKMAQASNVSGKAHNLKLLELAEGAAESISDGDLVDRMIHGSQQQWSLMPTHAIFSFVKPASYVYGNFGSQVGFTSWLGNNSKQGKLSRYVKEIQSHMRLRTTADRHEIRQQYMSALWEKTIGATKTQGKDSVEDVIEFMDSYYLSKDDYDAIMELGLGPMDQESVKIDTQTKAAFTRLYNSRDHPRSHQKAGDAGMARLGGAAKRDKPDLEEAVDEEDDLVEADVVEDDDEELDLKKDKFIKAPKKKAAPKAKVDSKGKGKGKGKRAKDEDDDEDEEEEDEPKPKKKAAASGGRGGGGAGRGKGRGRGKG